MTGVQGRKEVASDETYEKQQGHHYTWGPNEMSRKKWENNLRQRGVNGEQIKDFVFTYPNCGKVCKSKDGLKIHQVWMHQKQRKTFTCSKCNASFAWENNPKSHEKKVHVERMEDPSRTRCRTCGKDISKTNIVRHRRPCGHHREVRGDQDAGMMVNPLAPRVYRAERREGSNCGRMLAKTDMAKHQQTWWGGWQ